MSASALAENEMLSLYTEKVACNICGSFSTELLYPSTIDAETMRPHPDHFRCTTSMYGKHSNIVRCKVCGLVYTNPRLETRLVEENYLAVQDPLYEAERDGRLLTFRRNLVPLEKLVPGPLAARRLLDVGCHIGVLLEVAQERGWNATGVEPSEWASKVAKGHGLQVLNTTLANARFAPNTFDAVTLWDVIEHLTDPAGDLKIAYNVLKPGGVIGIHTIDIESFLARVMSSRWPWLMEMHLYYFSPRTLGRLLTNIGFQVEQVVYLGRYLRVQYLLGRMERISPAFARFATSIATSLNVSAIPIPINTFDIFTILARKPDNKS